MRQLTVFCKGTIYRVLITLRTLRDLLAMMAILSTLYFILSRGRLEPLALKTKTKKFSLLAFPPLSGHLGSSALPLFLTINQGSIE